MTSTTFPIPILPTTSAPYLNFTALGEAHPLQPAYISFNVFLTDRSGSQTLPAHRARKILRSEPCVPETGSRSGPGADLLPRNGHSLGNDERLLGSRKAVIPNDALPNGALL